MGMANTQPESNGERIPDLEEIDATEVNFNDDYDVPMVEAAAPKKPGFGFGKALLWSLLFLVVTQGLVGAAVMAGFFLFVFSGGMDAAAVDANNPALQNAIKVAALLAPICGAIFSILVMRWIIGRDWYRRIGLRLPNLEHVILILVAFPAVEALAILAEVYVNRHVPGFSVMDDFAKGLAAWPWWLSLAAIAVGPGISEELWCRGFVGWGLSNRYGFPIAVLLTSFLFGCIHIHPPQAIMAMLLGVFLHLTYLCTRSLWVPIFLHFLHNSLAVFNDADRVQIPFHDSLKHSLFIVEPVWFPLSALILAVVAGIALYQYRVRVWLPDGLGQPARGVLIPTERGISLLPRPLHPMLVGGVVCSALLFGWFWLGL
jgi:membrane protease YdiL (CAAX protease family)